MAPSNFIFNSPVVGGTQPFEKATDCLSLKLNIMRKLRTASGILLTGWVDFFNWVLFLWDHINHAFVAKIYGTRGFVNIRTTKSDKDPWTASKLFTHPNSKHHTDFTKCIVSSARQPQIWYVGSKILFLLSRFAFVGSLFSASLPKKVFNFTWTLNFHKLDQKLFVPPSLKPRQISLLTNHINIYS